MQDTGARATRALLASVRSLRGHARSGAAVLTSTAVAGVLAYASVAVSARILGASDFGLLGSMLATASIVSVGVRPLHTGATHLAAELRAHGQESAVPGIIGPSLAVAAIVASGLVALALTFAQPLRSLYRAPDATSVAMLALFLSSLAYTQFTTGLLLGQQRFNAFAWGSVLEAFGRAMLTAPLALTAGVSGVLGCYVAGTAAANAYIIGVLGGVQWKPAKSTHVGTAVRAGLWSFILTFVIALLQHADLIALRTYAPAEVVGWYASAATVGALVYSVAAPVYLPLYPRLISALRAGQSGRPILGGTLLLIAVAGTSAVGLSALYGGFVSALLFGEEFAAAGELLPAYLAKTTALLAFFLLGQYAIVADKAKALPITLFPAAAALAALALLRPGPFEAALTGFLAAAACIGSLAVSILASHVRAVRATS